MTVANDYLKAIVSGDSIDTQYPHSYRPSVRLVAATITNGYIRRAIILSFNRQFTEAEQDKKLKDKLLQEGWVPSSCR